MTTTNDAHAQEIRDRDRKIGDLRRALDDTTRDALRLEAEVEMLRADVETARQTNERLSDWLATTRESLGSARAMVVERSAAWQQERDRRQQLDVEVSALMEQRGRTAIPAVDALLDMLDMLPDDVGIPEDLGDFLTLMTALHAEARS